MPLLLATGYPTLVIRKPAFERVGLSRGAIDIRLGLTADEFRVEGDLVVVGPIVDGDALAALVRDLEDAGLGHFDDFFDFSGRWPDWIRLFAMGDAGRDAGRPPNDE